MRGRRNLNAFGNASKLERGGNTQGLGKVVNLKSILREME